MQKIQVGEQKVEYMRHVISTEKMATDSKKIDVVRNYLVPESLKELKGFLRLACYYRKFITGFRVISKPLIDLPKKNNFGWHGRA
jgi:hypothetical protein